MDTNTIIISGGVEQSFLSGTAGAYFAIKYFLPIYDERIDQTIHSVSGVCSVMDISASFHTGDLVPEGEIIFNVDGYEYSTNEYLLTTTGEISSYAGVSIISGSNKNAISQVNTISGEAQPLSDLYSGSNFNLTSEISGIWNISPNATLIPKSTLIDTYAVLSGTDRSKFFPVTSYSPIGSISADNIRGLFKCKLFNDDGNFKFNKIALYLAKMLSNGTEDTSVPLTLFAITAVRNPILKTKNGNDITNVEVDIELEIYVADSTGVNIQFLTNDYWYKVPALSGNSLFFDGDVGIGTSGINWSSPNAKMSITEKDGRSQLRLNYDDLGQYTDFKVDSSGNLIINPTTGEIEIQKTGLNNGIWSIKTLGDKLYFQDLTNTIDADTIYFTNNVSGTNDDMGLNFSMRTNSKESKIAWRSFDENKDIFKISANSANYSGSSIINIESRPDGSVAVPRGICTFSYQGSEKIFIGNDGSIGILTSSPSALLDLQATSLASYPALNISDSGNATSFKIDKTYISSGLGIFVINGNNLQDDLDKGIFIKSLGITSTDADKSLTCIEISGCKNLGTNASVLKGIDINSLQQLGDWSYGNVYGINITTLSGDYSYGINITNIAGYFLSSGLTISNITSKQATANAYGINVSNIISYNNNVYGLYFENLGDSILGTYTYGIYLKTSTFESVTYTFGIYSEGTAPSYFGGNVVFDGSIGMGTNTVNETLTFKVNSLGIGFCANSSNAPKISWHNDSPTGNEIFKISAIPGGYSDQFITIESFSSGYTPNICQFKYNSLPVMSIMRTGAVSIGISSTPTTSCILDIGGDVGTGAVRLPQLTTTQINALTKASGMIVYNTSIGCICFCGDTGSGDTWYKLNTFTAL